MNTAASSPRAEWPDITSGLARELVAFSFFAVLAIVMTWPLATNLQRAVAGPSDPYLNAWILDWDHFALSHGRTPFETNMFYPARDTLAFSENLIGIFLVVVPLQIAGMAPLTVHNVAMLLGFAFTGYGAFVLSRLVTRSSFAGVAGGIVFAFLPWRFAQLGHLQHMWAGWLPLLVAALLHYSRRPSWSRALLFGGCFLMNGLTNLHWFAFGSVAIAVAIVIVAVLERRGLVLGFLVPLAVTTALALLFLIPVLLPYREASTLYGIRGSASETMMYSALPSDWLKTIPSHRIYGKLFSGEGVDGERWLFPGLLSLLLAATGLTSGRRVMRSPKGAEDVDQNSSVIMIAVGLILLGFAGSLGLHFFFHRFLFDYIPLFRGIRVPARWSVIAYLGITILAAKGSMMLSPSRGAMRLAARGMLLIALVAEMYTAPIRWYTQPVAPLNVDQWLASAPFRGPIVQLPLRQDDQYLYLLRSTTHHRAMINGVSGASPPLFDGIVALEASDPISPGFIDALERLRLSLVVVHVDLLADRAPAVRNWLREQIRDGRLTFVRHFSDSLQGDFVFAVTRTEPRASWLRTPEVPDRAGRTPLQNLDIFLNNDGRSYCDVTFGMIDSPPSGLRVKGELKVGGWALSPSGVREVNILFGNGRLRIPAERFVYDGIDRLFPWYPRTIQSGYRRTFARRPHGLPASTDVQIEIIDGEGKRTLLPDVWITWIRQ